MIKCTVDSKIYRVLRLRQRQLTYRAEAVNDSSDGGDGFTGTLERLVLAQLSADCRGYQGEGTNDQTTLTTYKECLRQ